MRIAQQTAQLESGGTRSRDCSARFLDWAPEAYGTIQVMSEEALSLSREQKSDLLERYGGQCRISELTYGTVSDFCDSCDHISYLTHIQGDLKDLQRPAALKAILALCPPGSSVLEVGAGEPHVSHILSELGYAVTVVDPYDGSGRGPTEFEHYQQKYSNVQIIRDVFSHQLTGLEPNSFDCIYSISVLEHVHQPALSSLFSGIRRFLKPGGYSLHLIDHVLCGEGEDFHLRQLAEIAALQADLAGEKPSELLCSFVTVLNKLTLDLETYYLSAEGHNRWRGATSYHSFPFRKVVSVHSCKKYVNKASP
jgi:2-polyprenyl-3-methyl-5-hydroxy-6-metoxy-1,4-benzoquinol methylase